MVFIKFFVRARSNESGNCWEKIQCRGNCELSPYDDNAISFEIIISPISNYGQIEHYYYYIHIYSIRVFLVRVMKVAMSLQLQ